MKKLLKKLEDIMVAVTFAEAGEYDEANKYSGDALLEDISRPVQGFKNTALENARK
jgi:hypothetical protein